VLQFGCGWRGGAVNICWSDATVTLKKRLPVQKIYLLFRPSRQLNFVEKSMGEEEEI
jgi:hypothetical protein